MAKYPANTLAALKDIEAHGIDKALVTCRQIEGKLWEIKIAAQRVFYVLIEGLTMILRHAYKKQGQRLPKRNFLLRRKG